MQDYRVNVNTVVKQFNTAHVGKTYEKGHGWKQFKRWEHMMGQRVGTDGIRPNQAVLYQAIHAQKTATSVDSVSYTQPTLPTTSRF